MAEPILVMGKSGTGKSTALRNLDPKKTIIISPNAKSLPFPGGRKNYVVGENWIVCNELDTIPLIMDEISNNKPHVTRVILEDFTHQFSARIFSANFMSRTQGGEAFTRWNDFGYSVFQAIFARAQEWRQDLKIIVNHHTEIKEDGSVDFKSAGKLLDNTIYFSSYFTIILHAIVQEGKDNKSNYVFQTNISGIRNAKSPMGMFKELYVPNDLEPILATIDAYNNGEL